MPAVLGFALIIVFAYMYLENFIEKAIKVSKVLLAAAAVLFVVDITLTYFHLLPTWLQAYSPATAHSNLLEYILSAGLLVGIAIGGGFFIMFIAALLLLIDDWDDDSDPVDWYSKK